MARRPPRVSAYAARRQPHPVPARAQWPQLQRAYHGRSLPSPEFAEEQIQEVLHRVEKYSPEDELNCGACGYDSCRQKAAAVLRGMAEVTMCIPYMRTRAESLTNVVMDVTPNGVLIVDNALHVQDVSPAAEWMCNCHRAAARGRPLRGSIPIGEDSVAAGAAG
ncbi:(Fe-S)-binding protein, partial [Candidatus Hakubella thermalkaliphila]|uniref:(Fe-S)-binding protein n=1 Tax=Candidatus Hakubella thermalkaliphila TaxID=2754717 RepID=UPI0023DD76C0